MLPAAGEMTRDTRWIIRVLGDLTDIRLDLEPDADPPKVLAIEPDNAANLLWVIWLELDDDRDLAIHAMPLDATFFSLLSDQEPRP